MDGNTFDTNYNRFFNLMKASKDREAYNLLIEDPCLVNRMGPSEVFYFCERLRDNVSEKAALYLLTRVLLGYAEIARKAGVHNFKVERVPASKLERILESLVAGVGDILEGVGLGNSDNGSQLLSLGSDVDGLED